MHHGTNKKTHKSNDSKVRQNEQHENDSNFTIICAATIPKELIQHVEAVKETFAWLAKGVVPSSGTKVEKLKGLDSVYSIRYSKTGRIIFTKSILNHKPCYIVVDVLENHNYENCKWINNKKAASNLKKDIKAIGLSDFDLDVLKIVEQKNNDNDNSNNIDAIPFNEVQIKRGHYYNETYLVFDDTQQQAIDVQTLPLIIDGPPGSGKTAVALALMQEATQAKKVLYVTHSKNLVDSIKEQWDKQNIEDDKVDILQYRDIVQCSDKNPKETFQGWLNEYCKKTNIKQHKNFFIKHKDDVYEEFRIICGMDIEVYKNNGFGAKQTIFNSIDKRTLIKNAYDAYMVFLVEKSIQFEAFTHLPDEKSGSYDLVVVDESQDFSHLQLKNLSKLARNKNILFCIDNRQNLFDQNPKSIFIKQLLIDKESNQPPSIITFKRHYRCPKNIMSVAKVFNDIRINLRKKAKHEAELITETNNNNPGKLKWYEPNEADNMLKEVSKDANACVVTHQNFKNELLKYGIKWVFTPQEIKGLEFEKVVLYKILNTQNINEVCKLLKCNVTSDEQTYSTDLSECFVATTRATDSLIIVQKSQKANKQRPLIKLLKDKFPEDSKKINFQESDKQAWLDQAEYIKKQGFEKVALEVIKETECNSNNQNKSGNSTFQSMEPSKRSNLNTKKSKKKKNKKNRKKNKNGKRWENLNNKKKLTPANKDFDPFHLCEATLIYCLGKMSYGYDPSHEAMIVFKLKNVYNSHPGAFKHCINKINFDEFTFFHLVCRYGYNKVVQFLLKKGLIELEIKSRKHKATALRIAIIYEKTDIIKMLIKQGAHIDVDTFKEALRNNNDKIIEAIVKAAPNLIVDTKVKCTALMAFCQLGKIDYVELCIQHGSNLNLKDSDGRTSIHYAVLENKIEVLKKLIDAGADINIVDNYGYTPLNCAVLQRHREIVSMLLDKKDVDLYAGKTKEIIKSQNNNYLPHYEHNNDQATLEANDNTNLTPVVNDYQKPKTNNKDAKG